MTLGLTTPSATTNKVLFVDDEPNLLQSYKRHMRGRFKLDVAQSGAEALERVSRDGPYAVIISDLKMPEMDGIELLSRVREVSPSTVRMILTGYSDVYAALDAINSGQVFRFMTKPCSMKTLAAAVEDGLHQYRLLANEKKVAGLSRVKEAMEAVITGYSRLVEARDPFTGAHQRRVAKLAMAMATAMDVYADRIYILGLAALVHDVGKVCVPAEYLNKPARLTEAEFGVIRQHPRVGHEILEPLHHIWPLDDIVLSHHERLDGSGYPQGLSGDQIMLEARILAVADVVEAMSTNRPWRPRHGTEATLTFIREARGVLFDPAAVDACCKVLEKNEVNLE